MSKQVAANFSRYNPKKILRDFDSHAFVYFKGLFRRNAFGDDASESEIIIPDEIMAYFSGDRLKYLEMGHEYTHEGYVRQITYIEQIIIGLVDVCRGLILDKGHLHLHLKDAFENAVIDGQPELPPLVFDEQMPPFQITETNEALINANLINAVIWQAIDYLGQLSTLMTKPSERMAVLLTWHQALLFFGQHHFDPVVLIAKGAVSQKFREHIEDHFRHDVSKVYHWFLKQSDMGNFSSVLYKERVADRYWQHFSHLVERQSYDAARRILDLLSPEIPVLMEMTDFHRLCTCVADLNAIIKADPVMRASNAALFVSRESSLTSMGSIHTVPLYSPAPILREARAIQLESPLATPLLKAHRVSISSDEDLFDSPAISLVEPKKPSRVKAICFSVLAGLFSAGAAFALPYCFDHRFKQLVHEHKGLTAAICSVSFLLITSALYFTYSCCAKAKKQARVRNPDAPWHAVRKYSMLASFLWEMLDQARDPVSFQLISNMESLYLTEPTSFQLLQQLTQCSGQSRSPGASFSSSFMGRFESGRRTPDSTTQWP